jgi:2-polyprenyl-6-methoxyphenol hydroxylase-like FAD-dependent oxidoreductase
MKIAIIGGGTFGVMTAIRLAELGETVHLFERLPDLMQGGLVQREPAAPGLSLSAR